MDVDGLMLSADNVYGATLHNEISTFSGEVIVDSGAYRMLTSGKSFNVKDVIEWQGSISGDIFVPLDYPIKRGETPNEAKLKIERTLENISLWLDVFGNEKIMPVLHGHTIEQLNYAIDLLERKYGRIFRYIALGSLADIARYNMRRAIELALYLRRVFRNVHLHALGCGNSLASILSIIGFDSVDLSSHLQNSRYGLVRNPISLKLHVIVKFEYSSYGDHRPKITPEELFSICNCPACKTRDFEIAKWGRRGFLLRSIHNAWVLKHMIEDKRVNSSWLKLKEDTLKMLNF